LEACVRGRMDGVPLPSMGEGARRAGEGNPVIFLALYQ
jgi:hypothetical protein